MTYLSEILTIGLGLASVAVWVRVFSRMSSGEPPIEYRGQPSSHPNSWVALFVFFIASVLLVFAEAPVDGGVDAADQDTMSEAVETSDDTVEDATIEGDLDRGADSEGQTPPRSESANVAGDAVMPVDSDPSSEEDDANPAMVSEDALLLMGLGFEIVTILFLWAVVAATTETAEGWGVRWDHPSRQAAIGVAGAMAAILPTMIVGALAQNLGEEQQVIQTLRQSESISTWLLMAAAAVVAAPMMEEMMFRVVLQGWLTSRIRAEPAIAWTAMFFAAVHGWPAMVGLMPFALMIGYVYYQTRSLICVLAMHMTFNGSMLLILAADVFGKSAG